MARVCALGADPARLRHEAWLRIESGSGDADYDLAEEKLY
jgi:hypothetical protein